MDHNWVREEIVRFLEDHDYTLCIHTRDFVPTATIPHNIKLAIKHSRRMISVVSRSNKIYSYFIQIEEISTSVLKRFSLFHTKVLLF